MTKTTGDAQKRARAEQRKPCCEGYVGMATFNAQVCLDRDATLRKVLVKHEALETAQLWVKLHKHGYHCTKQDVSRFRFRRKNGSLHVAPPEDGDVHANAEAEYIRHGGKHRGRWRRQRAREGRLRGRLRWHFWNSRRRRNRRQRRKLQLRMQPARLRHRRQQQWPP